MGVNKAGGTNVYASTTPADASAVVDFLETQLVAAGWSIVSGSGTDAITFQSAATTNGSYAIRIITSVTSGRVRLKAAGGDGSNEQSNYFANLLPDGVSDWYILANRYGAVVFEQGSISSSRKFAMFGCLYLPSSSAGDSSIQAIASGDISTDGNTTLRNSFRNCIRFDATSGSAYMAGASAWREKYSDTSQRVADPKWIGPGAIEGAPAAESHPWFNGDVFATDALLAFGTPDTTSDPKIQGWFFDTIILHGVNYPELREFDFDGDTYVTFGGNDGTAESSPKFCIGFLKPAA